MSLRFADTRGWLLPVPLPVGPGPSRRANVEAPRGAPTGSDSRTATGPPDGRRPDRRRSRRKAHGRSRIRAQPHVRPGRGRRGYARAAGTHPRTTCSSAPTSQPVRRGGETEASAHARRPRSPTGSGPRQQRLRARRSGERPSVPPPATQPSVLRGRPRHFGLRQPRRTCRGCGSRPVVFSTSPRRAWDQTADP